MAQVVPNPKKIRAFKSDAAFEAWMHANHARETEIWHEDGDRSRPEDRGAGGDARARRDDRLRESTPTKDVISVAAVI